MNTATSWIDELFGTAGTAVTDVTGTLGALEAVGAALIDPQTYVRIFMVIFGFLLVLGSFRYA